tara:strand:- start:1495 stop:1632 length:138 start_codon:yes stop_codon:yes gene_type:complete
MKEEHTSISVRKQEKPTVAPFRPASEKESSMKAAVFYEPNKPLVI